MSARPQLPGPEILPTSSQHLQAYGRFWDVVSILVFSGAALSVLIGNWGELTWRHWTVFALTLAQGGLYVFAVATRGWPIARRWLTLYFVGGIAMWVIAGLLQPTMWWLGMTYFGQMFGLLPARVVVPGSLILDLLVILHITEWDLTQASSGLLFGFGFMWLSCMAVYFFIASIIRTSQDRGKLIAELEAAQRELEIARQKDVELATLRERERLARDLHDSLGHALVVMTVQLEAIQRLYRVDAERGSAQVDTLKTLTRRSMDDLRRSLNGLRAPGLGDQPLSAALPTLSVEAGQRANLQISCRVPPEADQLSPVIAETLWRVTQEALANIEKHARARHVAIKLEFLPAAVALRVTDDGLGLPSEAEGQPGHYGLRGMRERVEGLGGTLTLGRDQGGTTIEARLPIIGHESATA